MKRRKKKNEFKLTFRERIDEFLFVINYRYADRKREILCLLVIIIAMALFIALVFKLDYDCEQEIERLYRERYKPVGGLG